MEYINTQHEYNVFHLLNFDNTNWNILWMWTP